MPKPPARTLLEPLPSRVSSRFDPVRFSIVERVSPSASPPVAEAGHQADIHARGGSNVSCRVRSQATNQRIGAAKASEDIVAGVAGDDVGERIAGSVDGGCAGEGQVLDNTLGMDCIREAEGDRGLDRVGSIAIGLVGDVARIVDHIGVIAGTAHHRIGACTTIQRVIAAETGEHVGTRIAGDDVIEVIAGPCDCGRAGERQVLDCAKGSQREGQRCLDRVDAIATGFIDDVAGIVHHIDVVAKAAKHRVGAEAAIEVSLPAPP